jgi:dTDP-glucose 4,6-dehydratase
MRVLVTGGAGFIGSNFVNYLLKDESREIQLVNLDKLTYAGNMENLADLEEGVKYRFVRGDIADAGIVDEVFEDHKPDILVHFAAESHVDRSIEDASPFITTNVLGTQILLDASLKYGLERFVHVSTDEVYGTLDEDDPAFTEETPLAPNSPYSASKAGSDLLVRASCETFGLNAVITRCSNNYGPFQFPEKLIPLMIRNALANEPLPVYGDGSNIRDWIFVEDHCQALALLMEGGGKGEVYNIGGNSEHRNLDVVKAILRILGKPESLIRFVQDRLGHDFRYAIDSTKMKEELDWEPSVDFERGLESTIQWYLDNPTWVDNVITGEYQTYYESMYGQRLAE